MTTRKRRRVQKPKPVRHTYSEMREFDSGPRAPRYRRAEIRNLEQRGVWE